METTAEPTHVRCFECNTDTEIEPGDEPSDTPCARCEDQGDDAFCTVPIAILDCPNGVTVADWRPGVGFINGKDCDDDSHEPRTGKHIVEIDH